MSEASEVVVALFRSGPHLIRLMLSLGWMYTTLGWRVRSTRRAFEKELLRQGMSKEDAKRLSEAFEELKDNVLGALRGGVFSGFSTRF
ncbi:MAG TPA: hypothetical protein VMS95_07175 [Candidatus Krumholzibacteriaceae bacterium]|nr:hypothetical protein [Candidatus Krumholzibacteriaceae bacterium]